SKSSGRCQTLGAAIADIGFGRSDLVAWWCPDSVRGYVNRAAPQSGGSIVLQKLLDDTFGLAVISLAEVVITNSPFPIDEVVCRPVFVVERLPNPVVAIDRDRVGNVQIARCPFYVRVYFLERELRRMHTDHHQTRILIFCRPGLHVRQISQA